MRNADPRTSQSVAIGNTSTHVSQPRTLPCWACREATEGHVMSARGLSVPFFARNVTHCTSYTCSKWLSAIRIEARGRASYIHDTAAHGLTGASGRAHPTLRHRQVSETRPIAPPGHTCHRDSNGTGRGGEGGGGGSSTLTRTELKVHPAFCVIPWYIEMLFY